MEHLSWANSAHSQWLVVNLNKAQTVTIAFVNATYAATSLPTLAAADQLNS